MSTDYDEIANAYDMRYARYSYPGIKATLKDFVDGAPKSVLELGCGTGYFLAELARSGHSATGIDPSARMLAHARSRADCAQLVQGRAEALPFPDASFDRVIVINALHHFLDPRTAIGEARRVLRPGGAFLTIGLDPAKEKDEWFVYDYFAGTRLRDVERYPATSTICRWLDEAGFERSKTTLAEVISQPFSARTALADAALKSSTSQLADLSNEAFDSGVAAIESDTTRCEDEGHVLMLRVRIHLFSTIGDVGR